MFVSNEKHRWKKLYSSDSRWIKYGNIHIKLKSLLLCIYVFLAMTISWYLLYVHVYASRKKGNTSNKNTHLHTGIRNLIFKILVMLVTRMVWFKVIAHGSVHCSSTAVQFFPGHIMLFFRPSIFSLLLIFFLRSNFFLFSANFLWYCFFFHSHIEINFVSDSDIMPFRDHTAPVNKAYKTVCILMLS